MITNKDIMEELQVSKKEKKAAKLRAQVKSRWYYIFWGTATFAVVAGQLYVGTGYRVMSGAFFQLMENIELELDRDYWHENRPRHPMLTPEHI